MTRSAVVLLWFVTLLMPCCGSADSQRRAAAGSPPTVTPTIMAEGPAPSGPSAKLIEMLRDPLLWGPDKMAVLDSVPAFAAAGEAQIEILPRQVVGRHAYKSRVEAEPAARRADQAMKQPRAARVPLNGADAQPQTLGAAAPVEFPDDGSMRVGTPQREARFIADNVRIDEVTKRFGAPDSVTTEMLDDGTERRPIKLTMYHFAQDAIVVVTADYNSDPRKVDRVLLDTSAVMNAVF